MIKIDLRVTRNIGDWMSENVYVVHELHFHGWMNVSISKALRDINVILEKFAPFKTHK